MSNDTTNKILDQARARIVDSLINFAELLHSHDASSEPFNSEFILKDVADMLALLTYGINAELSAQAIGESLLESGYAPDICIDEYLVEYYQQKNEEASHE